DRRRRGLGGRVACGLARLLVRGRLRRRRRGRAGAAPPLGARGGRRPRGGAGEPRRGALVPRGRLRADAAHDPLHRQAAHAGRAAAAARPPRVAVLSRRPRLLLSMARRRIVFITQVVDPADANLGATRAKIAALARRVDEVVVLCDRGVGGVLPGNCRLRVFGAPRRVQRAARYVSALTSELREKPVAVVGHMVPLYTLVAAPFVRARRVPLMLWYTHWKGHVVLRLAILVCTHLLSLDVRSFPLRSRKLYGIGHGI